MATFKIGNRVRIAEGSGIDSGKLGTIIKPGRYDWRGVPLLPGEYKPLEAFGPHARLWIRLDTGETITMFRSRLFAI